MVMERLSWALISLMKNCTCKPGVNEWCVVELVSVVLVVNHGLHLMPVLLVGSPFPLSSTSPNLSHPFMFSLFICSI